MRRHATVAGRRAHALPDVRVRHGRDAHLARDGIAGSPRTLARRQQSVDRSVRDGDLRSVACHDQRRFVSRQFRDESSHRRNHEWRRGGLGLEGQSVVANKVRDQGLLADTICSEPFSIVKIFFLKGAIPAVL